MKQIISISIIVLIFNLTNLYSQGFHYDTIPNPNVSSKTTYESPVSQQQYNNDTEKSGFDKNKLVLGGSLGATFGDYTMINIAPQVGYAFNRFLTAGGGISYIYYRYSNYYYNGSLSQNYLGFNVYGRVNPIPYIAFQVQPEIYGMWGNHDDNKIVPCLLVGGGGTIPAGARGGISLMLYYDVIQNQYTPYSNNIFYSIGYVFSF